MASAAGLSRIHKNKYKSDHSSLQYSKQMFEARFPFLAYSLDFQQPWWEVRNNIWLQWKPLYPIPTTSAAAGFGSSAEL